MVLSEVSNREAILALLFIETAWWGTNYIGILFPSLVGLSTNMLPSLVFSWIAFLSVVSVASFRFLSIGIFWLAVFQKQISTLKKLLKVWFVIAIVLDALIILIGAFFAVEQGTLDRDIGHLAILIILRSVFWIFAIFIIRDVEPEEEKIENGPQGIHDWTWSMEKVFFLFEVFWYPVLVIGGVQLVILNQYEVMLPIQNITLRETVLVYFLVFITAMITLVGILKNWKLFLKFWTWVYIGVALLYCFVSILEFFQVLYSGRLYGTTRRGSWINLGVAVAFPLIASGLRLVTIIRTIKFAYTPTKRENDGEDMDEVFATTDFEKEPLISSAIALQSQKLN